MKMFSVYSKNKETDLAIPTVLEGTVDEMVGFSLITTAATS